MAKFKVHRKRPVGPDLEIEADEVSVEDDHYRFYDSEDGGATEKTVELVPKSGVTRVQRVED